MSTKRNDTSNDLYLQPFSMQTSIDSPSNVALRKFLLDSTTKQAIQATLASKPHLSALYAAWCRHQEAVHHMNAQGSNLFALLVDQGIGQAVAPIRGGEATPIWKNRRSATPHTPKGKKPVKSAKIRSPSTEVETTTPKPKTASVGRVTIDLTRDTTPVKNTPSSSRSTPRYVIGALCYGCGKRGHFQSSCPNFHCYACGRAAPGHYPRHCPEMQGPIDDGTYYDDPHDETAWANTTGEPYGDQ